jgi:predicted HicB family RNase H-like nuclease
MSAPTQNRNAAKDEEEKATSFLHIRATQRDKARWVLAARAAGKKLSDWVTELLNASSK